MLEYVIFLKVILLVLVYKTHIECLIYLCQKLVGSRRSFRGVTATGINPLPSRTPLAKQPEYTEPLLHLFCYFYCLCDITYRCKSTKGLAYQIKKVRICILKSLELSELLVLLKSLKLLKSPES